ncbi:unnamed protein product [Effrenium voratum]|uniref:Uncharacterized protein n=1 Tax=Effrenium voratum TaxID=2562239 RepID=A0AA36IYH2_9DINO|nr:unnamed protein product [Effrenium voratum]CAJ1451293.1 unnamed protein product [Effrenium voratum]
MAVQRMMENARGDEWQSLYHAIKSVEQQIMSRDASTGKEDPREVFKHIQNHLNKEYPGSS